MFSDIFVNVCAQEKNKSGSASVQILQKENGKNKLIKSIGSASEASDIAILVSKAQNEIQLLLRQRTLFVSKQETSIEIFISELSNGQIKTIGPELVFGKIYDYIGYNKIDREFISTFGHSPIGIPFK